MTPTIELISVSKSFARRHCGGFKNLLLHFREYGKARVAPHRVLDGLSLSVFPGQSIGITGANGCGKSTLLGLIGGVLYPDGGTVRVNGRVGMMLELCAGFCPEFSGRENIILNGVLQGARRDYMRRMEEEIIAFSGVEEAIDAPVFTYSSGMLARLGFAINIKLGAEILLIDEALTVGDADFRGQCLAEVVKLKHRGTTIVLVSHNPDELRNFCDTVYRLRHGTLETFAEL